MLGLRLPAAAIVGSALLVGALPDVAASSGLTPRIYWTANLGGALGEANLDGTAVDYSLVTGASAPYGIAVDGQHVFWANLSTATIGRASLDGSGANQSFITGASNPIQVAVDGQYVYWANETSGAIGRANLDGTGVDQSFITGASFPLGIAVDSGHIYWGNIGTETIGRANLDGSGVDESFITGASIPYGLAVDGQHVYWSNESIGTIGRANLDGSGVDQAFIGGATGPIGVAVDSGHIYWANYLAGTIGRASLDGSGVDQSFVGGVDHPLGLAVQAVPDAPTNVSAAAGIGQATVTFAAPAGNGSPVASYTVTADPGGETATGSSSPIAMDGLAADTAYTFTVTATNDVGTSAASTASNSVVPTGPPDAAKSRLTPTSSNIAANGSATQVLTVAARDAGGVGVAGGGATVAIGKTAGSGTIGPVTDHGDGTYTATVTAPGSAGSGTFAATVGGAPVESGTGSRTLATIHYSAQPTIASFTPGSGGVHASVTLVGTNLKEITQVKLNGTSAAFSIVSATQLTFTVPVGAMTGTISVANAGATATSAGTFTVLRQPTITGFTPASGPVGTTVTVTGTNLTGTVAVRVGSIITVPTSVTPTSVEFTVPPGAGSGPITVLGAAGSATSATAFLATG